MQSLLAGLLNGAGCAQVTGSPELDLWCWQTSFIQTKSWSFCGYELAFSFLSFSFFFLFIFFLLFPFYLFSSFPSFSLLFSSPFFLFFSSHLQRAHCCAPTLFATSTMAGCSTSQLRIPISRLRVAFQCTFDTDVRLPSQMTSSPHGRITTLN